MQNSHADSLSTTIYLLFVNMFPASANFSDDKLRLHLTTEDVLRQNKRVCNLFLFSCATQSRLILFQYFAPFSSEFCVQRAPFECYFDRTDRETREKQTASSLCLHTSNHKCPWLVCFSLVCHIANVSCKSREGSTNFDRLKVSNTHFPIVHMSNTSFATWKSWIKKWARIETVCQHHCWCDICQHQSVGGMSVGIETVCQLFLWHLHMLTQVFLLTILKCNNIHPDLHTAEISLFGAISVKIACGPLFLLMKFYFEFMKGSFMCFFNFPKLIQWSQSYNLFPETKTKNYLSHAEHLNQFKMWNLLYCLTGWVLELGESCVHFACCQLKLWNCFEGKLNMVWIEAD